MMQVVDLQASEGFQGLGLELLSISPDPVSAWQQEGEALGISTPLLSDEDNAVATEYGVMRWAMASGEPGHTFVLVDETGKIVWLRDYGAPENGGLMYVGPVELVPQIGEALGR